MIDAGGGAPDALDRHETGGVRLKAPRTGAQGHFWAKDWSWGYGLLLPAILAVCLVIVYPMISLVLESVTTTTSEGFGAASHSTFVGLANFKALFSDPAFWTSFRNNLIILVSVPIRIIIGLFVTQVIYKGIWGSRIYQTLIFLPFVAPVASVGIIFIYLLNESGPINGFLNALGLGSLAHGWLTDQNLAMWSISAVVLWSRLGFTVLLFMARMLSVDRQIFQAAFVDGANWRQAYWRVGVPELRRTIEFVAMLGFIESFSWSFSYVFVLSQGAFQTNSWILEIYTYSHAFRGITYGLAAATAMFLLVIAALVAAYRFAIQRRELA